MRRARSSSSTTRSGPVRTSSSCAPLFSSSSPLPPNLSLTLPLTGPYNFQRWRSILDDGARLEGLLVLSIHRSETNPPQSARVSDTSALVAEALPLSFGAISAFLQEAFRFEATPSILTSFIFRETGGNAFYVRRLLAQLVDKVFQFDYSSLSWQVDLGALPTYAADGIDQFVARAVADVSPDTLRVLQVRSRPSNPHSALACLTQELTPGDLPPPFSP